MKYKIILRHTDEGISVSVPALPGCWSEGDTEEQALANIRDAIADYPTALDDRFRGEEVREKAFTMGEIVQDAGLSVETFRRLL